MWKLFPLLLPLLAISEKKAVACKDCGAVLRGSQARYDFHRIYSVELGSEQHVELFQQLENKSSDSMILIGSPSKVGQKLTILVSAHLVAHMADLLQTYGIKHRVLTKNFQEKIDKNMAEVLPIGTDLKLFDWDHYFHLETIYDWMTLMAHQHSDVVTLLDMGTSTQDVPIKGLKIETNPANKIIFIESGIHGREWIAPATATYIINELLTSSDPVIQNLTTNYNWIIFPSINPDGYKYSFEHDRMWRKSRQLFGICRGVDLNRNFPDHWNTTGTSGDPCRSYFSGPSAASEVETQRLINFIQNEIPKGQIKTYVALHSYAQMLMFPNGYTKEKISNYDDLEEFGQKAVARIKNLTGTNYTSGCMIKLLYPASGVSADWAYNQAGIPIAFTFELRGPAYNEDLFLLPAAEIKPTATEAFAALQAIIEAAAEKNYYQ